MQPRVGLWAWLLIMGPFGAGGIRPILRRPIAALSTLPGTSTAETAETTAHAHALLSHPLVQSTSRPRGRTILGPRHVQLFTSDSLFGVAMACPWDMYMVLLTLLCSATLRHVLRL